MWLSHHWHTDLYSVILLSKSTLDSFGCDSVVRKCTYGWNDQIHKLITLWILYQGILDWANKSNTLLNTLMHIHRRMCSCDWTYLLQIDTFPLVVSDYSHWCTKFMFNIVITWRSEKSLYNIEVWLAKCSVATWRIVQMHLVNWIKSSTQ